MYTQDEKVLCDAIKSGDMLKMMQVMGNHIIIPPPPAAAESEVYTFV